VRLCMMHKRYAVIVNRPTHYSLAELKCTTLLVADDYIDLKVSDQER